MQHTFTSHFDHDLADVRLCDITVNCTYIKDPGLHPQMRGAL